MKLNSLVNFLIKQKLLDNVKLHDSRYTLGISDSGKHILYPLLQQTYESDIAIITSNDDIAKETFESIKHYTDTKVIFFPENTHFNFEPNQYSRDMGIERLKALAAINKDVQSNKIIIASCNSATQKTINKKDLMSFIVQLKINFEIDVIELIEKLIEIGYQSTNVVIHPGQYSKRGGIIDVFAINNENPTRIEFNSEQ